MYKKIYLWLGFTFTKYHRNSDGRIHCSFVQRFPRYMQDALEQRETAA